MNQPAQQRVRIKLEFSLARKRSVRALMDQSGLIWGECGYNALRTLQANIYVHFPERATVAILQRTELRALVSWTS